MLICLYYKVIVTESCKSESVPPSPWSSWQLERVVSQMLTHFLHFCPASDLLSDSWLNCSSSLFLKVNPTAHYNQQADQDSIHHTFSLMKMTVFPVQLIQRTAAMGENGRRDCILSYLMKEEMVIDWFLPSVHMDYSTLTLNTDPIMNEMKTFWKYIE